MIVMLGGLQKDEDFALVRQLLWNANWASARPAKMLHPKVELLLLR